MQQSEPGVETQQAPRDGDGVVRSRYILPRTMRIGKIALTRVQDFREFLHRDMNLPRVTSSEEKYQTQKKEREGEIDDLKHIINQSKEVIAHVTTIFPLTLFPDDIVLDRTKVTIIQRSFFWSWNVLSVHIEDILNVKCSVGPFFGSVTISIRVMNSVDHFEVQRLWRSDAIEMKCLIQGFMFARHNKVALDDMSVDEVVKTLEELGEDSSTNKK